MTLNDISIGLKDTPVESLAEEVLGLNRYSNALTQFVKQCQTPMTIALQGDWGSGKTSLMNLIKANLSEEKDKYSIIWFNTWQYSQFGLQDELPLSLIGYFMEQLGAPEESKKTLNSLLAGARRNIGGALWGIGEAVEGALGLALKASSGVICPQDGKNQVDLAKEVAILKNQAETAVKNKLSFSPYGRVVVFIDDLDRLYPVKAVELLEAFKLFMEISGCVYILACDYKVISQGLNLKFNMGEKQLKGKSFFDKIIQLPFQMPVAQYEVNKYIELLLQNIGIDFIPNDINIYHELIEFSIGFNPRNLKRAFNCLLLLNIVVFNDENYNKFIKHAEKRELQRVLFAGICLQRAYEELYNYLVKNASFINNKMMIDLQNEDNYVQGELSDIFKLSENENSRFEIQKLTKFMKSFYEAIQLKSDGNDNFLSDDEAEHLRNVLTFAKVTSNGEESSLSSSLDWDRRRRNRRVANALIAEFNASQSSLLKKIEAECFKIYQGHGCNDAIVYISVGSKFQTLFGTYIELKFDISEYSLYLNAPVGFESQIWLNALKQILPENYQSELKCYYDNSYYDNAQVFLILKGYFIYNIIEIEQINLLKSKFNIIFSALKQIIAIIK
jgi:hypothetical protein